MTIKINVAGTWKTSAPKINVAGTWKTPTVKINVAGTWKASGGPSVSIDVNGRTNVRENANCFSGALFYTTGVNYEYTATGGTSNVGNWLDAGSASDVWIQWVRTGGTLGSWNSINPGTGRVQVTVNRNYRIVRASTGTDTIQGYFRAYDAATGGNLLDTGATGTYSAQRTFNGCPTCCFTPDTPVTLASGLEMPIGRVRKGDKILIQRPENGEFTWEKVGEVIVRYDRAMYKVYFSDGTYLHASDDHPFVVPGKGYASINPLYEYKELGLPETLDVGDPVTTVDGKTVTVTAIKRSPYTGAVITFSNTFWFANGKLVL
jgi:hypothetical protein